MALPRLLLFWLSDTVTELLHRASSPSIPPTQSPITHTCVRQQSTKTWIHTNINQLHLCMLYQDHQQYWLNFWTYAPLNKPIIIRIPITPPLGITLTWPLKDAPSKDLMKSLYTWLARKMTVATASWYCGAEVAKRGRAASGMWSWLLDRQLSS